MLAAVINFSFLSSSSTAGAAAAAPAAAAKAAAPVEEEVDALDGESNFWSAVSEHDVEMFLQHNKCLTEWRHLSVMSRS